jgi:hypothetical protein
LFCTPEIVEVVAREISMPKKCYETRLI